MGAFEYKALNVAGKELTGVLEGDTPRQVRQLLRDRKLMPLQVMEVAKTEAKKSKGISLRRGISATDLALVTRQLATLVRSGLPLEEALLAVGEQSEKPRLTSILLGVRARVMEGHALADGLGDFPQAFPEIYVATIAAGEQSGHLDAILERLADYTESRQVLKQKISNAMIYPIILTTLAITIVTGLLVYIVPKVVEVYENSNAVLPLATRILIGTSEFLLDYGILLAGGVIGSIFLFRRILKEKGPRRRFHRFILGSPIIGRLSRGLNTARFTRTFSILASSGVPIIEALRISGEVVTNIPMHEAIKEASLRIREGAPISRSLGVSKLFPPMTIHLISSGEASGELDDMLGRAATSQEREMDGMIGALIGILEPVMVVLMGLVVLFIVFALLLPIFNLNQLVR